MTAELAYDLCKFVLYFCPKCNRMIYFTVVDTKLFASENTVGMSHLGKRKTTISIVQTTPYSNPTLAAKQIVNMYVLTHILCKEKNRRQKGISYYKLSKNV